MSRSHMPRDSRTRDCKCGESRPAAVTQHGRCYECTLARAGKKRTELHHPFGRGDPNVRKIIVEIPGNWHRVLDAHRARREPILERPGDNSLHQIAAIVTTIGEAAEAFADYARREQWPEWVFALANCFGQVAHAAADWLLILAGKLDDNLGPAWAEELGMPPLCL